MQGENTLNIYCIKIQIWHKVVNWEWEEAGHLYPNF